MSRFEILDKRTSPHNIIDKRFRKTYFSWLIIYS